MLKKLIVWIIIIGSGGWGVSIIYDRIIQRRVADFLVYGACDQGELDNYFNIDHVHNLGSIYQRMKTSMPQFKISENHLARYGKGDKKKVFRNATGFGKAIVEECGSSVRTLHQARHFSALILKQSIP